MPNTSSKPQQITKYGNLKEVLHESFFTTFKKHKRKSHHTAKYIAEEISVGVSTIEDWGKRECQSCPSVPVLLELTELYGVDFLNDTLFPFGLGGARKLDGESTPVSMMHLEVATFNNLITIARADNKITHQERAEMKKAAQELINNLVGFIGECE